MINVSELIGDPDFCQPNGISITRSISEYVNHKLKYTEKNIKLTGIITIADENEDSLLSEADMNKERIHIFTYDRLKTTGYDKVNGGQYKSDIIHFEGNDYIVRYCLNDSQYGFCRSTAVKIDPSSMWGDIIGR